MHRCNCLRHRVGQEIAKGREALPAEPLRITQACRGRRGEVSKTPCSASCGSGSETDGSGVAAKTHHVLMALRTQSPFRSGAQPGFRSPPGPPFWAPPCRRSQAWKGPWPPGVSAGEAPPRLPARSRRSPAPPRPHSGGCSPGSHYFGALFSLLKLFFSPGLVEGAREAAGSLGFGHERRLLFQGQQRAKRGVSPAPLPRCHLCS